MKILFSIILCVLILVLFGALLYVTLSMDSIFGLVIGAFGPIFIALLLSIVIASIWFKNN